MKKNILLFSAVIIFTLVFMLGLYSCGSVPVKKSVTPAPNITCDEKADEAMKEKRYEKSVVLHEFFTKENPDNGLAMYHMGYSYGQLGDRENEVKYYEDAINHGFYGYSIFFNLGMVYGEMGRFEDSVRIFKKAIEIEPDRADNHFGLALAYQRMSDYELAENEFKNAVKLDPDDIDSIFFLGVCYSETGRIDEANKQLEKIIEIDPESDMALKLRLILENKSKDNTGN